MKLLQLILTITLAALQIAIAVIPLKHKIADGRRRFPEDWTLWGKRLLFCCFMALLITAIQYAVNDKVSNNAQTSLQDSLRNRDSKNTQRLNEGLQKRDSENQKKIESLVDIYAHKTDSSYKKSEDNFGETSAKFGLHYDAGIGRLEKKIDTSKTEIDPYIGLSAPGIALDSIKKTTYYVSYTIACKRAPAYDVNLTIDQVQMMSSGRLILINSDGEADIQKDGWAVDEPTRIAIQLRSGMSDDIGTFYVRIKGTYYNKTKRRIFAVNEIYAYNFFTQKGWNYGNANPRDRDILIKFLKSKGL